MITDGFLMIYFDNAATTKVCEKAAKAVYSAMTGTFGNPSSVHALGFEAEKLLKNSRNTVLNALGSIDRNDSLYFTSGGTEANNLAIFGALSSKKHGGKTVFFSDSEHASVHNVSVELKKRGYNVKYIPTKGGKLDIVFCEKEFDSDTVLISCMTANNETGAVYDIRSLCEIKKRKCPEAYLHTDAVQAFGKIPSLSRLGADLISISGHKIGAPKGVGALYVRAGKKISPLVFGGGQEGDTRAGTQASPEIAVFGPLFEKNFEEEYAAVEIIRNHLVLKISEQIPEIKINIPEKYLPHIVSLTLPSIKSEVMLRYLSAKEIYVSSGSACTSKHRENRVLSAFGLDFASADCTIRLSFSAENMPEQTDVFIKELEAGLSSLARIK